MQLDWKKIAEEQRPRAERDVKAGLLLERIAEAEAFEADEEEIDAQIERYAQQKKMSMSRARQELAESGALDNVRSNLVNEKTLNYLFDESEKVAASKSGTVAGSAAGPQPVPQIPAHRPATKMAGQ